MDGLACDSWHRASRRPPASHSPSDARLPSVAPGAADWPCWRGPTGDSKSPVTGIRKDWSGGLTKLWEVSFLCQGTHTATWSSPVVCGNRLVVPGRDGHNDLVFCLDSGTGALIWSKSYPAKTGTSHGPGPRATPCIDQDRVYTFGRGGDLACWRLLDGQLLWQQNVKNVGGKEPTWGHAASPVVYEDKVLVQGGGQALVVAYDKMTGRLLWKSMEGIAGYATIVLWKTQGTTRLLVFHGTGLACLDPAAGTVLWTVPWKTAYDVNASTPTVADATIFITSGYNTGCQALQAQDGQVNRSGKARSSPRNIRTPSFWTASSTATPARASRTGLFQMRRARHRPGEMEHRRHRLGHDTLC